MDISTKCRVCLNGDRRMYSINTTVLQEIWEKLTSARFDSNDGRPVLACYICCEQLRKSHQLRERALQAEELLTDFIMNGFEQSQERLSLIASLSYDLKYDYASESFMCYESEQISKNPLKEIKKDIVEANKEDDKEGNEEYSHMKIKNEKDDYLISHHHIEYLDLVEDESNTHYDAKASLRNIIVQTQIEVPTIFEQTDPGAPTRKRRADDVPPTENDSNVCGRIKERKLSNNGLNFSLPDNNFEFNKNVTGNVHTNYINSQNIVSSLNAEDFRNISSVSNPERIKNSDKDDNDMFNSEDGVNQSISKNVESSDLLNALDNIKEENEIDTVISKTGAEKDLLCHICKCKFGSKGKLVAHIRTHTGEKPYQCELCDYRFSIKRNLNKHIKSKHANEKYYLCHLCQSKFTRNSILNIHLRIHSGEKPYTCDLCDYRCVRKYNLVQHIKIKHMKEKNYSCHICQCKYVSRGALNVHLRKHTGEKPYTCEFCDHRFSQKSNLKQHIKFIHTGEMNFSCHICQRQFVRQDHLNRHFRQHTGEKPYTCDICDTRFSEKSHLTRHLKYIHAMEKDYTCHICQNKFARKGTLDTHLRMHTGEKPYMCGICDNVFAQCCSLKAHIKAHHPS